MHEINGVLGYLLLHAPFACLLGLLIHLIALHCSCAPVRSFARSFTPELIGKIYVYEFNSSLSIGFKPGDEISLESRLFDMGVKIILIP